MLVKTSDFIDTLIYSAKEKNRNYNVIYSAYKKLKDNCINDDFGNPSYYNLSILKDEEKSIIYSSVINAYKNKYMAPVSMEDLIGNKVFVNSPCYVDDSNISMNRINVLQ